MEIKIAFFNISNAANKIYSLVKFFGFLQLPTKHRRQIQRTVNQSNINMLSLIPVSYTHLDVYKRQA